MSYYDCYINHYTLDSIKIESIVHPNRRWEVKLEKPTTANQVCRKMAYKLGANYTSFELYEIQGSMSMQSLLLLSFTLLISFYREADSWKSNCARSSGFVGCKY